MKILGMTEKTYYGTGAVVELTYEEVRILLSGDPHERVAEPQVGQTFDICKRARALLDLERAVAKAKEASSQLRGMAQALDAVVAAAVSAITPIPSEPPQA